MNSSPRHRRELATGRHSPLGRRSGLTILGKHFAVIWRGRGWELVAVVALLIIALALWLELK